jgi:triosephosphate isomerase (TIM)
MHGTIQESLKLITGLERFLKTPPDIDVAVAPPFTTCYSVGITLQDLPYALAAQNCHWEDKGAYTGEIAATFLSEIGCKYVILGHSERRQHFGETDAQINKKINAVLRNEMIPVICLGETDAERKSDKTWAVLERQLRACFVGLHNKEGEHCVVAYEPVWAIGTGNAATADMAEEVHHFIRNNLEKQFDAPTAETIRILYGGSVKRDNASAYAKMPDIDGALVGGASLDPEEFADIVRAFDQGERITGALQ